MNIMNIFSKEIRLTKQFDFYSMIIQFFDQNKIGDKFKKIITTLDTDLFIDMNLKNFV